MNGGPLENKSTRGRVSRISSLLNEKKKKGRKKEKRRNGKKERRNKGKGKRER